MIEGPLASFHKIHLLLLFTKCFMKQMLICLPFSTHFLAFFIPFPLISCNLSLCFVLNSHEHISARLLGDDQIRLDPICQRPPHLSLGLWESENLCLSEPSIHYGTSVPFLNIQTAPELTSVRLFLPQFILVLLKPLALLWQCTIIVSTLPVLQLWKKGPTSINMPSGNFLTLCFCFCFFNFIFLHFVIFIFNFFVSTINLLLYWII